MRHATIAIAIGLVGIAGAARAQGGGGGGGAGGTGVLVGAVHDSANAAISAARVDVPGTAVGAVTSADGSFRLVNIPAGPRTVVVHRLGFAPDSARVDILAGGTVVHNFVLAPAAVNLASVVDKIVNHRDRKSTRLNSSHSQISYAVFCLKKKK